MRTSWTLVEALEFVHTFSTLAKKHGYAAALGGSVLTKGRSDKDIDVIVFPLRTDKGAMENTMREAMINDGMKLVYDEAFVKAEWKRLYDSYDEKRVDVWSWLGKRIDIFWLR